MGALFERYLSEQRAEKAGETPLQKAFREEQERAQAATTARIPPAVPADAIRTGAPPSNPNAHTLTGAAGLVARVAGMGASALENPIGTAAGIVTALPHALKTGGEFMAQTAAEMTLPQHEQNIAFQDPTRISEKDAAFAAAQLATIPAAGLATPVARALSPAVRGTEGAAAASVAPGLAPRVLTNAALSTGAGAAFTPDDPLAGAVVGLGFGAAHAVPKIGAARELAGQMRTGEAEAALLPGRMRRVPGGASNVERLDAARVDPLAEATVPPNPAPAPAGAPSPTGATASGAGRAFQVGTGKGTRRPAATVTPERVAPPVEPPTAPTPPQTAYGAETVPSIGKPVSVGGESRIPADAPKVPRPQGLEPIGTVEQEGAVSAGRMPTLAEPKGPAPRADDVEAAHAIPAPDRDATLRSQSGQFVYARNEKGVLRKKLEAVHTAGLEHELTDLVRANAAEDQATHHLSQDAVDAFGLTEEGTKGGKAGGVLNNAEQMQEVRNNAAETGPKAAVLRRMALRDAQITRIETELKGRGVDSGEVLERRMKDTEPPVPAPVEPTPEPVALSKAGDYPAAWDEVPPDATKAPKDFLRWATFGLKGHPEAMWQEKVESLRASGHVEKTYKSLEDQHAESRAFANKLLNDPLGVDVEKMGRLSGAEQVGVAQVISENMVKIEGLSRAIESGELSAAEMAQAETLIDRAHETVDKMAGKFVTERGQTGRDLGSHRLVAHLTTDPAVWIVRAKKILGSEPMSDGLMIEIRKLARAAEEACRG